MPQLVHARSLVLLSLAFALPVCSVTAGAQQLTATTAADRTFGRLPLSFVPNQGQTDPAVKFVSQGPGYRIFLAPDAATFAFDHGLPKAGVRKASVTPPAKLDLVRMRVVGGDPKAAIAPEQRLPGYVNYMRGGNRKNWHLGVPTYAATRVQGIYPGIDLVYYGTQRQLEYDFVVKPGAQPSAIHLGMDGATPKLTAAGDLLLQIGKSAAAQDLRFHKPVLYQQIDGKRRAVDGAFNLASNGDVSFRVGTYDHTRELVIDPIILYASYYGGNGNDYIQGSAINASNELYIVGQTNSTNLPGVAGEYLPNVPNAQQGLYTGFISKISADGSTVLWTTYLGGENGNDYVNAVAVSSTDEAYLTGYASSEGDNGSNVPGQPGAEFSFPITTDAIQVLCGGAGYSGTDPNAPYIAEISNCQPSPDAFVSRLSSDGKTLIYSTFLGGSQNDVGFAIKLDSSNNIYVAGITNSTKYDFSNQQGCAAPAYPVNSSGTEAFGYADFPTTNGLAYEPSYYLASTQAPPGKDNDCQNTVQGIDNAFLSVLAADGHSMLYSTTIGGLNLGGSGNGTSDTYLYAMTVASPGIVYLGGATSSASWPIKGPVPTSSCSPYNADDVCVQTGWLSAFDITKVQQASLVFSTYMTGASAGTNSGTQLIPTSHVYGLATDSAGNVLATGDTTANDFPTTAGVLQPACVMASYGNADENTCSNAYITKLSTDGSVVWSTYYGSTAKPFAGELLAGQSIAVDSKDNVYVVGTTNSGSLPLKNAIVSSPADTDVFLVELSSDASQVLFGTYLGATGGVNLNNNSLQIDSKLNAYFSGYQQYSTNGNQSLPTTAGAVATTGLGGSSDGFFVKIATQLQSSITKLTITPDSAAPGASVALTATVTGVTGLPVPTGTVTLTSGTTSLGLITLAAGTGTLTSSTLPAGTYNVVGTYLGDVVYSGSVSASKPLDIQATPTISLTATPNPTTFGTSVSLKATVASTGDTPSGTVYFMDGTATLGSATLAGGVASYSAAALAVGTHSITARYSGGTGFVSVTSSAVSVVVALATPTVTLTATPASATVGTAVALGVTVTGTGATPGGSVKFLDGSTLLDTATLSSTGTASYSAAALAIGTHTITAVYGGNTDFATVTSAAQSVTIVGVTPTVTLTASPSSAIVGNAIALSATVAGTAGSPSGSVQFFDGTTSLNTAVLSGGTATFSAASLAVGTHSITASYSGDGTYAAAVSAAQTVTINPIPAALTAVASPSSLTIKSGASGASVITLTPSGGFAGVITLSCGTLPSYAECGFVPASLTFTAASSSPQSTTLTFFTNGPAHAMLRGSPLNLPGSGLPGAILAAMLLPLAFTRRARRLLRGRSRVTLALALLLSLGMAAVSGCGSGAGPTTAPGTYSVSVTVGGAPTATTLNLSVTVQ